MAKDPVKIFLYFVIGFSLFSYIISQFSLLVILSPHAAPDGKINGASLIYTIKTMVTGDKIITSEKIKEKVNVDSNENEKIKTEVIVQKVTTIKKKTEKSKVVDVEHDVKKSETLNHAEDKVGQLPNKRDDSKTVIVEEDPVFDESIAKLWKIQPRSSSSVTCEEYFGNGYNEQTNVCTALTSREEDSSISCSFSRALESSVCEIKNLLVNRDFIDVSNGGEPIRSVWGRDEGSEFIKYRPGAFTLQGCSLPPNSDIDAKKYPHHISKMLESISITSLNCDEMIDKVALFVTRYEYANLYHTMTDWYNVFQMLRIYGLKPEDAIIVFMDGHSQGSLDDVWPTVFSEPRYISSFQKRVCFRRVILVPPGYNSILSISYMHSNTLSCVSNPFVADFRQFFLDRYNLDNVKPPLPESVHKVKVLFRRDYAAHPRIGQRHASRKIANELELILTVNEAIAGSAVEKISFEQISTLDQIKVVRNSDVFIGFHGAGLSYALFLPQHSVMVELSSDIYAQRVHFKYFSAWAGITYHVASFPQRGDDSNMIVDLNVIKSVLSNAYSALKVTLKKIALEGPKRLVTHAIHRKKVTRELVTSSNELVVNFKQSKNIAHGSTPKFLLPLLPEIESGKHRLAIIVPFRDSSSLTSQGANRTANLNTFIPYMRNHLKNVDFRIIVVEQTDGHVFNKGALFNIGYQLAKFDYDYICLHDVDQIPISKENKYSFVEFPTHLCTASSQFDFKMAYGSMVGGALLLQTVHFEKFNGLSNKFFGWGQEDDDLYNRISHNFDGKLERLPENVGRYQALEHPRVKDLDITKMFNGGRKYLMASIAGQVKYSKDGASQTTYTVKKWTASGTHDRVLVELTLPFMPKSLDEDAPNGFYDI